MVSASEQSDVRRSIWKSANMTETDATVRIEEELDGVSALERRGLRVVYTREDTRHFPPLLPELAMLGWSCFPRAQVEGLAPHVHEDAFEVCCLVDGRVDWWVGGKTYTVGRGDAFVTRPGEPHGGADALMHPCELYWLQIIMPDDAPLPGLTVEATAALCTAMAAIEARRFPVSPEVLTLFTDLLTEHRSAADEFAAVSARALLHRLLVRVCRDYAAFVAMPRGGELSPPIAHALSLMSARLGEPFCIEEVAASVGLSVPRFSERFREETGLPPTEWRVRRRVEEAKRLLGGPDATVTQVAHSLGFASSQYFATAFKKYTGRTPTDYRREKC
jgi:AraC-like DNA-binding protein/mannose-6-phosphate isomerase-like protein (cupin superfamily)